MTTPTSPAWTPEKQIEYLATKIMKWHLENDGGRYLNRIAYFDSRGKRMAGAWNSRVKSGKAKRGDEWNPLENWNHWRDLELVILNDSDLYFEYTKRIGRLFPHDFQAKADLPTRISALIFTHRELYPSDSH